MDTKLSPTMLAIIGYTREHGGSIHRHEGGFWARAEWTGPREQPWFGVQSIRALVDRGLMRWSVYHETRDGRFPVAAVLTDKTVEDKRETAQERRERIVANVRVALTMGRIPL